MENLTNKSNLPARAKQLDKKTQSKVGSVEAQNSIKAQELILFDEVFGIKKERNAEDKKRIENYFTNIAKKYEQSMPIPDSIVRLDQETDITQTLREGRPVLIRGNWRVGKTSMVESLATHQFGRENSLSIDTQVEIASYEGESFENFKRSFGVRKIAEFLVEREHDGEKLEDIFEREDEVKKQIKESQKSPFEFLNDYLKQREEKLFLSLDEVVGLANQPKKLKYLADLKDLSNIRLAVVLHRLAFSENSFKKIFDGYETHFVRSLTLEEVGKLVRKPLEGTQITFTDDAVERIFEFSGGRPMEINNVCHTLMDKYSEDQNCRFTYRGEDIDELIEKKHWQVIGSFRAAIFNYEQVYNQSMSEEERAIIDRLIKENGIPVSKINAKKFSH